MRAATGAGLTVAVAESLTAGAVCARIADVPGASLVLRGGVVAYATDVKAGLLGVPDLLLAQRGPVDPDVAVAMADGVRRRLGADIGAATTGVAGPGPADGHDPGTVYIATHDGVRGLAQRLDLTGGRAGVRRGAVDALIDQLCGVVADRSGPAPGDSR